jgi:hypothetical protein
VYVHLEPELDHVVFEYFGQRRENAQATGVWETPPRIILVCNFVQEMYYVLVERSVDVEHRNIFEVLWKGDFDACLHQFQSMCSDMWYEELQDQARERATARAGS